MNLQVLHEYKKEDETDNTILKNVYCIANDIERTFFNKKKQMLLFKTKIRKCLVIFSTSTTVLLPHTAQCTDSVCVEASFKNKLLSV